MLAHLARFDQQLAVVAADVEPEEIAPLVEVGDPGLVLIEDQTPGRQPGGQPRLDLLGLLLTVTQRKQIVGIADNDRRPGCRPRGIAAEAPISDPSGFL
jgi:hypothetical protein